MISMSLRKFCLCLPARIGALLLTAVSFCAGCILVGFDWVDVAQFVNRPSISHSEMASLIASALILTLVTVASFIGFAGAFSRSLRVLVPYTYAIMGLTLLSVAIGSFYLAILFGSDAEQRDINDCITGVTGGGPAVGMTISMCNYLYKTGRAVMAVTLVIYWLILGYNAYMSWVYMAELKQSLKMTGTTHPASASPAMSIFGAMPDSEDDVLDEKLRPRMPGALVEQPEMQHIPQLPRVPQAQPPQPPAVSQPPPNQSQPHQEPPSIQPSQAAETQEAKPKPQSEEPEWLYAPVPPPPRIGAPPTPEVRKMRRKREMSPNGSMRSRSTSASSSRSNSRDSIRTLVGANSSEAMDAPAAKPTRKPVPGFTDPFANPFPAPKMGSSDNV